MLAGLSSASAGDSGSVRAACTITGTDGDDTLVGTAQADVICGFGGDDVIRALGGHDIVYAGSGSDHVIGGRGADRLFGGPGSDRIGGGPGPDVIDGGASADELSGGTGNDALVAGGGTDSLDGGPGNDSTDQGNPPGLIFAWSVFLKVNYTLPAGSKIQWRYLTDTGNCFENWKEPWTDVANGEEPTHTLFSIPDYGAGDSCFYEKSYGTWNYQVTTPSGVSLGGNLYVTTGLANAVVHQAWAECAYTNPGLSCTPGYDAVGGQGTAGPAPTITIGPIDGGG